MDEKLYTASEIKKVLSGLSHMYYSKPWYSRWLYKPWLDCLVILDLMLCDKKEETLEDLFGIEEE